MSLPLTAGSLVAQTEPAPEVAGLALLMAIVIGGGMAYHAHNNGASAIIWGVVGFILGIFGILVYLGYLFVRSPPDEDTPEPVADSTSPGEQAGPAQPGSQPQAAETREPDSSWPPGTDNQTDHRDADDNQWRQVASELRTGSPSSTETEHQQTGTEQAVAPPETSDQPVDEPDEHGETTIETGEGQTDSRTTSQQERTTPQELGAGQSQPASTSGMAVELTYGNGDSDLLSGITRIERDDRALILTREDGRKRRYENARIERIWDEDER